MRESWAQDEVVERIISEADKRMKNQISIDERKIRADRKIIDVCRKENVNILESRGGSRRGRLSEVGAELAKALVRRHGLTFAETAR